MEKLSCAQAKQIDLVDYLASLGHSPTKINRQDYWYLSPFRNEKTPSFKVNRNLNVWFDFGDGKGGDMIDFGTRYFTCSISQLLEKLSALRLTENLSFHPQSPAHEITLWPSPANVTPAGEKKEQDTSKILILDERRLASKSLLDYIQKRKIPLELAEHFCREVDFLLYNKKYTAIGFKNNAGGFELRTPNFKGSSSPKDITFIDNIKERLSVFEGFFNFLSFQTILKNQSSSLTTLPDRQNNFLVLNSLSFFEKSKEKMESHQQILLHLDRDKAGIKLTQEALKWSEKYIDHSIRYKGFKDLNEYLVKQLEHRQKESQRLGRHF